MPDSYIPFVAYNPFPFFGGEFCFFEIEFLCADEEKGEGNVTLKMNTDDGEVQT